MLLMKVKTLVWRLIIFLINSSRPSDSYMHKKLGHHWFREWLVFGTKSLYQVIIWTSDALLLIGLFWKKIR